MVLNPSMIIKQEAWMKLRILRICTQALLAKGAADLLAPFLMKQTLNGFRILNTRPKRQAEGLSNNILRLAESLLNAPL